MKASLPGNTSSNIAVSCFIPGYYPGSARYQGASLLDSSKGKRNLPDKHEGPVSMLTRLGTQDEPPQRAVYPVQGHGLSLHPDGKSGFFAANQYPDNRMVAFDTASLDVIDYVRVNRKGWYGGGHAIYTSDGKHLLIPERYPDVPFSGNASKHYGVISIRDASSYNIIDEISCHGIAPHEITITDDGQFLLIANYGSTRDRGAGKDGQLPEIVEPSLTIIELSSGQLIEKMAGPDINNEIRHLTAPDLQRIFSIQVQLGSKEQAAQAMSGFGELYERDITADKGRAYLSALPVHMNSARDVATELKAVTQMDSFFARHGLSIIYEPRHDEILASFPSSHSLAIFDARDGRLKQLLRTDKMGLRHPCGLALHPDGEHYIVTGYWRNLYVFKRGSHQLNREACQYVSLFGHSHIAVS